MWPQNKAKQNKTNEGSIEVGVKCGLTGGLFSLHSTVYTMNTVAPHLFYIPWCVFPSSKQLCSLSSSIACQLSQLLQQNVKGTGWLRANLAADFPHFCSARINPMGSQGVHPEPNPWPQQLHFFSSFGATLSKVQELFLICAQGPYVVSGRKMRWAICKASVFPLY